MTIDDCMAVTSPDYTFKAHQKMMQRPIVVYLSLKGCQRVTSMTIL
jgi:hypothetical protein